MTSEIVVGIDGGGTHTRVIAADLTGRALASAEAGSASPYMTNLAQVNVQRAIREVIDRAGCSVRQVVGLVAGMAGLDAPKDQEWAERFTALPGLDCPRLQVNDAVVAHVGALSRPGIIAISGTGSIVFGVTEQSRHVRNYDFHHYAATSAGHLGFNVVHRILAEETQLEDETLIREILARWSVPDVGALRALGARGFCSNSVERARRFGEIGPLVTHAAWNDGPLARSVCDSAAASLGTGIRLVGSCFAEETVAVALIGGAVRSPYMQRAMAESLARSRPRRYEIVDPLLSCVAGAVQMALDRHGVVIDNAVRSRLRTTSEALLATAIPEG